MSVQLTTAGEESFSNPGLKLAVHLRLLNVLVAAKENLRHTKKDYLSIVDMHTLTLPSTKAAREGRPKGLRGAKWSEALPQELLKARHQNLKRNYDCYLKILRFTKNDDSVAVANPQAEYITVFLGPIVERCRLVCNKARGDDVQVSIH